MPSAMRIVTASTPSPPRGRRPSTTWGSLVGDLMLITEYGVTQGTTGIYDVRSVGGTPTVVAWPLDPGSPQPVGWEHFRFAPAALGSIGATDQGNPGLPNWPIYLDAN